MPTHLVLLGAGGFITMGTLRLIDPLLPAIAEDFGTSVGGVAATVTAFMLGYGLFQLVHGPLGDRAGKLRVMACALALCALATAGCALTASVGGLATLRFVGGMAAGAVVPLSLAHIGDTVAYDARQATIGRFLSWTLLGQMLAGSLAGLFAEYLGWRLAFVAFGAAGAVVAVRLARAAAAEARPAATGAAPAARRTHLGLLRSASTRRVWGGVFLEGSLLLGALPYAGAYLKHAFGLDYLAIGLVLGCFGAGGLLYTGTVRWLVRRLGERGLLLGGGLLVAACYAALAAAPSWPLFVPALTLVGAGFFALHSTLQTRATELAPQARGTALSGFAFCLFLGQGLGVYAYGLLIDGPGYRAAFAAAALGVALLAVWLRAAPSAAPR
jgi:predicted MFS family arabinose efflux permease